MSFGFGSGGFGQNNQPSNTFGGGGFGANTNNTTPGTYFHVIFLAVILVPFFCLLLLLLFLLSRQALTFTRLG